MSAVQDVSIGLSSFYVTDEVEDKGKAVEEYLTTVCESLGKASSILEDNADMEFLLMIVGSYIIGNKEGTLDEDVRPPSELFNENLIPMLDNMVLEVENITDDS